ISIRPTLYDGTVIAKETNVISIADSEETLMLEEESRSKMLLKQSDPMVSLVNTSLKKLKYHLGQFYSMVKKQTTPDALTEGNGEEEEFNLEDIQDIILREKLLSINRLIANIESLNDNPTPDCVLKSFASFPIFGESDNSLSDNSSPEYETFSDHMEETGSGYTTTHANNSLPEYDSFCFEIKPDQERLTSIGIENIDYDSEGDIRFLEELLVDDFIPFPDNESSNFNHHNNISFPRPPSKPPDVEFCFDLEPDLISDVIAEEISDELNEDEYFNPGGEFNVFKNVKDDDYFPFTFVIRIFLPYLIYPEVSPLLLSVESEDTIFDPGISV
nr:hypothetical protein [Tanacetum cinerariifolium]